MKLIISCCFYLLAYASLKGQSGLNVSASLGYSLPMAASKLNPLVESNLFRTNPAGVNATPVGSYGSGYIGKIGVGYALTNGIEPCIAISYQRMPNLRVSYQGAGSASSQSFNSNSIIITPLIRFKKLNSRLLTPYILFGVPISLTEVAIEMDYNNSSGRHFSNQYYPRQLSIGIQGGVGIQYRIKNTWQLYVDLTATGMNFIPKKGFFTTGGDSVPTVIQERALNTKEEREKYGRSVIMPLGNWGLTIGVRYNFSSQL